MKIGCILECIFIGFVIGMLTMCGLLRITGSNWKSVDSKWEKEIIARGSKVIARGGEVVACSRCGNAVCLNEKEQGPKVIQSKKGRVLCAKVRIVIAAVKK